MFYSYFFIKSFGNYENYCRNFDGELKFWCYMIEKDICWEICDILECGKNSINLLGLIYKFCNCDFRFLKLII